MQRLGVILNRRLAAVFLAELVSDFGEFGNKLFHVHRDADGVGLVGDGAVDALADPPGSISRELKPAFIFKFFHGFHQPQAAFLDKVGKLEVGVDVLFGDRYHQAQVGFDEFEFILQNHILKEHNAVVEGQKFFFAHGQRFKHLVVAAADAVNVGQGALQFVE